MVMFWITEGPCLFNFSKIIGQDQTPLAFDLVKHQFRVTKLPFPQKHVFELWKEARVPLENPTCGACKLLTSIQNKPQSHILPCDNNVFNKL